MDAARMVHLVTMRDHFGAKVLAARLGAEGVVWELRGADGPYPGLGAVYVYVDAGHADVARDVLAATEPVPLDDEEDLGELGAASLRDRPPIAVVLVVVGLLVLGAASAARVISGTGSPARSPAVPTTGP